MADKKNNWKTPLGAIKLIFIVAKVVNKIVFYEFLKEKTYILNYLGDMDENLKRKKENGKNYYLNCYWYR